jgi:hypothetical protein
MSTKQEAKKVLKAITAMVDYICECAEESDRGYAIDGEMYARLMCIMPNLSPMEYRKLKLLAIATGRVRQGSMAHTIEPVR